MTCGIYMLHFNNTNMVYIGQGTNVEVRYSTHISKMRRGVSAKKLQEAYNTFGEPTLEIILECVEEELDTMENQAIEIFNTVDTGFNSCYVAGGGCSLKGEDAGNSRFSNIEIISVFKFLVYNQNLSSKDISIYTGVSKSTIDAISCLRIHKWLKDSYPEEYILLENRLNISKLGKNKTLKERGIVYPRLISPTGIYYIVENTSQFAKDHKLNNGHLVQVLKGQEKQHKGWKLE